MDNHTPDKSNSDKEMHKEIASRARTISDLNKMTKFDRSMTREEIIAKVTGEKA